MKYNFEFDGYEYGDQYQRANVVFANKDWHIVFNNGEIVCVDYGVTTIDLADADGLFVCDNGKMYNVMLFLTDLEKKYDFFVDEFLTDQRLEDDHNDYVRGIR